jgi:hypothetical protein
MKLWLTALLVSAFLMSCSSQQLPGDSRSHIQGLWDKRMTKCGENRWAQVFGGIAEYKDFEWVSKELPVTDIDGNLNHVEWRVATSIKPGTPYRVWNPVWRRWDRDWSPLGGDPWNNSSRMIVEKRNGVVTYNGTRADLYRAETLKCSALPMTD